MIVQADNNYKRSKKNVIGCSNSTYKLNKWKAESCEKHGVKKKKCDCAAPFKLFCFPSTLRNSKERSKWEPGNSDRVCSIHFVDDQPSAKNPYPTLNMGYEKKQTNPRRVIKKFPLRNLVDVAGPSSDVAIERVDNASSTTHDLSSAIFAEHSYAATSATKSCDSCKSKSHLISSLVGKIKI